MKKNLLVACEYSGTVRDSFIAAGFNAVSCDVLATDAPGPHYMGDVRHLIFRPLADMLLGRIDSEEAARRMYKTYKGSTLRLGMGAYYDLTLGSFPLLSAADREILATIWDGIIAHPPCTRLCNSGVRWLAERNLWEDMRQGAAFFKMFLDCGIPKIAVENPVMHKYAADFIGRKHSQTVQPYEFGHSTSKRTGLWLVNLPLLAPTELVPKESRTHEIHKASPGPDRWKIRSTTFKGIADAMALQWGPLL